MPAIFQVDAFTTERFKGNPAAVCVLEGPADEEWMQAVAAEMNLSETAFIFPWKGGYNLRWFTPITEVDLCGHATLASAFILYNENMQPAAEAIRFFTKSGVLAVAQKNDLLQMDFPAEPPHEFIPPPALMRALGVADISAWRNRMDVLIELDDEVELKRLNPDFSALAELPVRGIIVTSRSHDSRYDFVSRFFAPRVGVNEDPVTGSAHCCLGPFWAKRLARKELVAYQASARGGVVNVAVDGERVKLSGHAVLVMRGEIC